jgi:carbamate kinase
MEVAVAHVQGGMGFMIAQTLTNELHARGIDRVVTAIVTTVRVDADDPSFLKPSKPIGRVLTQADAEKYERGEGWKIREISPGKFRRVVASPMPRYIMEIKLIRRAVQAGELLVVCGGGGIPVIQDPREGLCGVKAVIDKDLASALLAVELEAAHLMILTAVDYVSIDYGKPTQRQIKSMNVDEAQGWLDAGQFPAGSMGPKVQAAIQYLRSSRVADPAVTIGPLDRACDAARGLIGTRITRGAAAR